MTDKGGDREVEEFKHRVRIGKVVLDGNKNLKMALTQIKGISHQTSRSLIRRLGFDEKRKLGELSTLEIDKLDKNIQKLNQHLPEWMLNRRKDYFSGENLHLIGTDLEMSQREDIKREKRIRSYRGIRHSLGLPVRGQRTRTSFRKGGTVGVVRKKALRKEKKKE